MPDSQRGVRRGRRRRPTEALVGTSSWAAGPGRPRPGRGHPRVARPGRAAAARSTSRESLPEKQLVLDLEPRPDVEAGRAAIARDRDRPAQALAGSDVRDGIVACWVLMEEAAAEAGVARRPSETATELVVRFLHALDVDPRPVAELARLYHEARFSSHPMGAGARSRAQAGARVHPPRARSGEGRPMSREWRAWTGRVVVALLVVAGVNLALVGARPPARRDARVAAGRSRRWRPSYSPSRRWTPPAACPGPRLDMTLVRARVRTPARRCTGT